MAGYWLVPPARLSYDNTILADSPVAFWPMNESSGTVATDLTANAHNGTYNNGPTLGVAGPVSDGETGVSFSVATNQNQHVAPSFLFKSATATIEAWVKIAAAPSVARGIAGCSDGLANATTDKNLYVGTDGKLYFYAYDGASKNSSAPTSALPTGSWVHVVGVVDGVNIITYVNGAQVGSTACGNTFAGYTVNNFFIAAPANTTALVTGAAADYFDGSIAKVALYNYALSSTKIAAHYNAR
jgi:hypothetical protein